ncbi:hypothetical protein [Nocardia brasiliensis]|uniref:hypothetical protein n=1 Tax=Nocardia brasiliensis TaxID=37326 RepID=UPI0033F6DA9A
MSIFMNSPFGELDRMSGLNTPAQMVPKDFHEVPSASAPNPDMYAHSRPDVVNCLGDFCGRRPMTTGAAKNVAPLGSFRNAAYDN